MVLRLSEVQVKLLKRQQQSRLLTFGSFELPWTSHPMSQHLLRWGYMLNRCIGRCREVYIYIYMYICLFVCLYIYIYICVM